MGMRGRGTGSAKLLLFGEHAAVYGYPAVGLSLPERTHVEIEGGEEFWRVYESEASEKGGASRVAIDDVMALLGNALPGLATGGMVSIKSSIPRGVGLGSSAALCVALAEAALAVAAGGRPEDEAPPDRSTVWALAHRAERRFHGNPSGVDTGLATLGGLWRFDPRPPELPAVRHLDGFELHLVVAALPRPSSTAALVDALGVRLRQEPGAELALARLGGIAAEAAAVLSDGPGGMGRLGLLADEAEAILESLDLATPVQGRLIAAGRGAGAAGGKMSGAGGGGAFYLLFPEAGSAEEGARVVNATAAAMGLRLAVPARAMSFLPQLRADPMTVAARFQ